MAVYSTSGLIIKFILAPLDYTDTIGAHIFKWVGYLGYCFLYMFKILEDKMTSD